ncbi:MAG TPA: hypothetical protein VHX38_34505 [Pseudonocardiaceae bacterium]|nr:hypothetical protein [Pseudonocardiaceae bacterium]
MTVEEAAGPSDPSTAVEGLQQGRTTGFGCVVSELDGGIVFSFTC